MNIIEKIRLHYPLPITKLYAAVHLETDPRLQVQKLVDLFEGTVRHLVLIGLAGYTHYQLADSNVERLRPGLARPSLGHWVNLLKATAVPVEPHALSLLGSSPKKNHNSDAIGNVTRTFAQILDLDKKIRRVKLNHFLEAGVEFRNKKIGHGSLPKIQARQIVKPLEEALLLWLEELSILRQRKLVYIAQVEWQGSHFVYRGIDLNSGDSPLSFTAKGNETIHNNRVYLHNPDNGEFLSLYPFFIFDDDIRLLYAYYELSNQEKLTLRCPYEAPGAETPHYLDVDKTVVLGVSPVEKVEEKTTPSDVTDDREATYQPADKAVPDDDKEAPPPAQPKTKATESGYVPEEPQKIIRFDSLAQELENRIRQVCHSQVRYPVLWVLGTPRSGKTLLVQAVCQRAGWKYVNFTLDSGYLDSLIEQEETYRPEDFLSALRALCES